MAWEENTLSAWPAIREKLVELTDTGRIICRGQTRDYKDKSGGALTVFSSLDRSLEDVSDDGVKAETEREIARRFRAYAPNYLPYAEIRHLGDGRSFLMLMQHYGAPTRLVDWTSSIWVGAYFAARDDFDKDGIIIVFNGNALDNYAGKKHGHETENATLTCSDGLPKLMWNRYGPWVCRLMQMGHQIPRMIAQQGLFTVGGRLGINHLTAIDDIIPDDAEAPRKQLIRFSGSLKPEMLKALHEMGINGSTMFPGIDGVGKALTEFSHFPAAS